jgi:ubiquinone/menaquinone biosynthesis C-methylase UbiE
MELKQRKEADFHDTAYSQGLRHDVSKFYLILDSCHGFYRNHLRAHCKDNKVLELGCGQDSNAFFMAREGAAGVTGIDISSVAIDQAEQRAVRERITGTTFRVMDAEVLDFPDDTFDLICGVAILHHLDLSKTLSEIARTLKPGGTAIFLEPLCHNPIINLYRRLTPRLRTEDEHPLSMSDIRAVGNYFSKVETRFFHLLSLTMAPFYKLPAFDRLVSICDSSDQAMFKVAPFLRRYAWTVGMILSEPRKVRLAGWKKGEAQPSRELDGSRR